MTGEDAPKPRAVDVRPVMVAAVTHHFAPPAKGDRCRICGRLVDHPNHRASK